MIRRFLPSIFTALPAFFLVSLPALAGTPPGKAANTVILSEQGVRNLRIETVEAQEHDFELTALALGRIEAIPGNRAVVSSRVSGRIVNLSASVGDIVQADKVIATLESRQPGNPPPRVPLSAPRGGLVTESQARIGEPVEPDKVLLEITDLGEVHAVACVPEHLAGKMKPGTKARIRVAALPEEAFEGELLRFATAADRDTGTLDAIFRLPNPGLTLRPGMRAEFSIVLSRRANVISVPRAALQGDPAERFVYVADYELPNAFVKTPVIAGESNDRLVEIKEGLFPGDQVVTRGAYSLAFAGKGSVSLKEALDAAHGHEHNEDGSEKSATNQANPAHAGHDHEDHDHDHDHHHDGKHGGERPLSTLTLFSLAANGLLLLLLAAKAFSPSASTP